MMAHPHESLWPQIKTWAEADQVLQIYNLIEQRPHPKEQVVLGRFAIRALMFRDWNPKNIKILIGIADQTVATALKIGDADEANVLCYNMSSNLAGCWDDGFTRTREDFQKGKSYAERALEFRRELKKGPIAFSLAYWGRGIHEYFLGDFTAASESFRLSQQSAVEAARAEGKPTGISKDSSFHELIAAGYQALAQIALGDAQATADYAQVLRAFEGMKTISDDARQDAEIGLAQLQYTFAQPKTQTS